MFLSNHIGHGFAVQDSITGVFEGQMSISQSEITIANYIDLDIHRAYFFNSDETSLILGYGNTSLNNKSNTIRFDTIQKMCVGIDKSQYTANMVWLDSSYIPKAGIYNNGWMVLSSASAPNEALDVAGSVKIDSSIILKGEYYTQTDSVFTIPENISTVIIDSNVGFSEASITMPPNPKNGQIISLAVGDFGIGTLNILPNTGQNISSGTPVLHGGSIAYRYREQNSTWYRW